ncbi:ABC transporter ATP-binding protein [Corynebacterium sp. HS2168-gen11]|uniref:ABC transporter ATP-binding protein n=1 Tax=Corynebacterium sp. HS2168-gen11 TaxID=2974027 RepID=UPI00216AFAFC|nr:ABC transporter ATP-binding protein [Corynebacterium sp. HS2168-gen11]MCS4535125.1 ABC transporter ATP-binding protein [Corynebacterium sp. HS2168-gen11]
MTSSTPTVPVLELHDVVKAFHSKVAVNHVSLSVQSGTIVALLGPNGAGKTTTIEMCEGFQKPTSGTISVLGLNPVTEPDKVRAQVGIMLQDSGSYSGIRVEEMLRLSASYSADPLDPEWLMELLGLTNVRSTTYRRLSGGQRQRLSLGLAIITRPKLVFLDEPTAGMDAQSRLLVWTLIRQLRADGVTVILTTHLMDEAQSLADEVIIMDHGKIVMQGPPAQLRRGHDPHMQFETDKDLDLATSGMQALEVRAVRPNTYTLGVGITPAAIAQLSAELAVQGVLILSLNTHTRSLEDVFLEITGRSLRS